MNRFVGVFNRVMPLICALALLAVAGRARAGEEQPRVPLVERGPKVDGDLSDEVWKKAAELKLDGYCDAARRKKGEKPKNVTDVRILTDKENVYLSFSCPESHPDGPWIFDPKPIKTPWILKRCPNAQVLGGDYVAVFFDMGRWGLYNYYMFAVDGAGNLYKCFTWPHRYDLVLYGRGLPEAKAAAKVDKAGKRWTAEVSISLQGLLRHPAGGFPKIAGLDLRRLQWGEDRGKHKFSLYWTGMANVVGKRVRPQYDRMITWKPLFPKRYPVFSDSYACGEGWVQMVFPESFGHLKFDVGKIDNKIVSGQGSKLIGLADARAGWNVKQRPRYAKAFDAPRMETWEDSRPEYPQGEPRVAMTKPVRVPGAAAKFAAKPAVAAKGTGVEIAFKAAAATDVAVAIVDAEGKIVRHLAAGVLGDNPPKPLKPGLAQSLLWDRKDDAGKALKPGTYKVRVSLGLEPKFAHKIDIKKQWVEHDKWPKGLDVENLPNPPDPKKAWPPNHRGYSFGRTHYLTVDRQREEVYVQTRYVFDGKTGKMLREYKTKAKMPTRSRGRPVGNGEISVGPDGLFYIGGSNEIWRFDRDGKPAPFEAVGQHFIPEFWGGHSNPHRGICAAPDGELYKVHHYYPHTNTAHQVSRVGPDGRMKKFGFIGLRCPAAGVKVDREGNVYVGATLQPPGALPPKGWAEKLPKELRDKYPRVYGSIVKFGPEGGIVKPDEKGKLICPGSKGPRPYVAQGAKWVHPGFSPMLSRISDNRGGPGCACRNGRFDLDDFGRLFIPDAVYGRVEVVDSNGNTIMFFGARGAADKSGLELGWGTQVAVSDRACYIADYLRHHVSCMKLGYAVEEELAVP